MNRKIFFIFFILILGVFSTKTARAADQCDVKFPTGQGTGQCVANDQCVPKKSWRNNATVSVAPGEGLCDRSDYVCCVYWDEIQSGGTTATTSSGGKSADTLLGDAAALNQTKISGANSIPSLINRLISFLLYPIGAFALALYVWAGFTWMTSAGNSERTASALKIIVWTSLGVMVTLSSYVLVQFLFSQIK